MRKFSLFRTMLVFGLVVGLVGLTVTVDTRGAENDNTAVSWNNGNAGSCWIDFSAHSSVNLTSSGVSAPYPSGTLLDSTGNTMSVNSNCKNGVTVKVRTRGVSTPDGFSGDVLEDFEWKANTSSNQFTVDSGASSYGTFSSTGPLTTVGNSSNPAQFNFSISYQYLIDNQDIAGDYSVSLEYTVSS